MQKWHHRFLDVAELVASWSKDPSMKVGAVVYNPETMSILATGYNGVVRGMDSNAPGYYERPGKYMWIEHAERNALFNAARHGIRLEGMGIAINWAPCADCARAIAQTGLTEVVYPMPNLTPEQSERWGGNMTAAFHIFDTANVRRIILTPEESTNA